MCFGCWQEYGKPSVISPAVVLACGLVRRVYDFNCVGGNLHAQLDDWNIEDEHWESYSVYHDDCSPGQIEVERQCFDAFKALTLEERAAALALDAGFIDWEPNGVEPDGQR
jgi:hypothetical protein